MSIKRKVVFATLCLAVCLLAVPVTQAMAADIPKVSESSEIMPQMEYIYSASHDFSISGGKALMYATVDGHSSKATKCEITIELQEKGLLFWDTIETWHTVENGRSAELEASKKVTSGKSYRIVTTVTVWSGTDSETRTITSEAIKA